MGETGRSLKTRESEHRRAIRNGDENHFGISKHVVKTGHTILWDNVKILAFEANWRKRRIKEGTIMIENLILTMSRYFIFRKKWVDNEYKQSFGLPHYQVDNGVS